LALNGLITVVGKVVTNFGNRVHDVALGISHFDSELFSIPRVNGPDFTSEDHFSSSWMNVLGFEGSPEGVTLSTLVVTTPVVETGTVSFGGTTVVLPKACWILMIEIVVAWRGSWPLTWLAIIEFVHEVHVTVTNRFITSALVQSVGHCDGHITLRSVISRREGDVEVAILPSTD
jgi:hypothetical protein